MRWLDEPRDAAEQMLRQALDEAARRTGDEIARRRVWTRLSAPLPEPPARRPWAVRLALGTVLAGAVGGVLVWPRAHRGTVAPPPVVAQVAAPVATPAPALVEEAVPAVEPEPPRAMVDGPAVVRTRGRERMVVRLFGGADADLEPNTVLAVDGHHRPAVQKGRVSLSVPKQAPGKRFTMTAGRYFIAVLGTKFHVRVAGDSVGVDVDEGVVEVRRGGRAVLVQAGESWTSPFPEAVGRQAPLRSRARPPAAPAAARHVAITDEALAPVPQASPSLLAPSPASPPPAAAGPAPSPSVSTPPPPTAADRNREATAALRAGDPQRALAIFESVARGQGASAENAAYEAGRVLRDQLGRPSQALAAWNRYRARFPHGVLRAETDISIIETLASQGDTDQALSEAQAFLERYPRNERRAEVARLVDRLRARAPRTAP